MSLILEKRVIILEKVSGFLDISTGKGLFSGTPSQRFFCKRGLFSFVNISERGTFSRSYVPHFACEWPDRASYPSGSA